MCFSDVTAFSNVCLEYVCLPHVRSTSGHRHIITDCHIGMWNLGIWHTGIPNTARLAVGIHGSTSRYYVDAVFRTRREENCKDSGIPNTARLAVGIPGTSGHYVDAVLRTRREEHCKDSGIP